MTFTVVRAVRGAELAATAPRDGMKRGFATSAPLSSAAGMDLPHFEEILHLNLVNLAGIPPARGANPALSNFAKTIPGALE